MTATPIRFEDLDALTFEDEAPCAEASTELLEVDPSEDQNTGLPRVSPEPSSINDKVGLPRPMVPAKWQKFDADGNVVDIEKNVPAPWINGSNAVAGDFLSFRNDMSRAFTERLCCICGDALNRVVTIAATQGKRTTSAGWGHPRCVSLTVNTCPHFTKEAAQNWDTVAWLYEGPGVGLSEPTFSDLDDIDEEVTPLTRAQVAGLSRTNPWGE